MDEDYQKQILETKICSEKDIDYLLEVYRQSCLHVRAFMDIRFKHFTTYIAIMVMFGIVLKEIKDPKYSFVIAVCEIINSVLFNLLDTRTGEYLTNQNKTCISIEHKFKQLYPLVLQTATPALVPKTKYIKSSTVTKLIFGLFTLIWCFVALYYLQQYFLVLSAD